ncbi:MAG: TolC family protein [Bacteroidota bacterium]
MRLTKQIIRRVKILALLLVVVAGINATAARTPVPDTLQLADLREAAVRQDPRAVLPSLLKEATRLRIAALRAARLPQLTVHGQATWQSAVTEIPISIPGSSIPSPPQEQARAQLDADWTLFDAGRTGRQIEAERARLAENLAGVAVTEHAIRTATTDVYYAVLLAEAQRQTLALAAEDLDARLGIVARQVAEGTMLAADRAALAAERIAIQQQMDEAGASRQSARAVLSDLAGQPIAPTDILTLPDLALVVGYTLDLVREEAAEAVARPEVERLGLSTDRAHAEADARAAATRPTVSLFGQGGVGRPSPLNFLADEWEEFALVGVRLRWNAFDWGRTSREANALRIQAQIAEAEGDALRQQFARAIEDDRATLDRLETALAQDEEAVALRTEALRVAARQLDEGVLLADAYTRRLSDLARARLTRARHLIERAQAQTRLLSTLGRFPDTSSDLTSD